MITINRKRALNGIMGWHIVMLIFMLSFIAIAPPLAEAQVPRYINYQGKLTDANDDPVTGNISITIRIYNAESGGTALWTETQTTTVTRGIFSILLGNTTALTGLDFNSAYWYSVEVESDGEMTPRQRLTSVGYAINADKLDGYDASQFLRADADTSLTGALTVSGSITGSANGDITLDPTGTGNIVMKIDSTSGDFKVTDGTTNYVLVDSATGNVTMSNDLTVSGTIYGTIASTGGSSTFSSLTVTGASDLRGNVSNSTGALTIADALTQTGATNQVTFAGNVDAGNGLDVTGALTVSGATTLNSALDMNSNIDLDYSGTQAALDVTQASTGPAAQFAGQRVIVGANETTNANALSTGELYVLGDLEVDGTIYGSINSSGSQSLGATTVSSLTVTGTSDLQGNVSDSGGDFTIGDNLAVTGTSDLAGNVSDSGGAFTIADNTDITAAALTSGGTDDYALNITQTLNDTGAAGGSDVYRGIKLNLTETDKTGWNSVYLMDLQVGGTTKFSVDDAGRVTVATPTSGSHAVTKDYADSVVPASAGGWTDGAANVYLLTIGDNVGIGTASPTQKLEVVGTAKATTLTDGTFSVTAGAVTGATGNISMWTNNAGYITDDTSVPKNNVTNSGTLSFDWADDEVADALTISGGTINNTVIGGTTQAAGTFSALTLRNTSTTPTFTFIDDLGSDTMTYDSDASYPFYFSDKVSVQDILIRGSSPAVLTFGTGSSSINLIYDPATDEIRFSRGTFAQDFRNLVKNGSFESFSAMEEFHSYDSAYATATSAETQFGGMWNKNLGFQGGWQNFAPDDWTYVSGDVFQHAPTFFQTGFTSTDIDANSWKQDFTEGVSAVRLAAITSGNPAVTTPGKISQTITGLKPSAVYSIGVKMRVDTAGGTARVDIEGEEGDNPDRDTSTTLSADITTTSTSLSVASVTNFPKFGTIRVTQGAKTEDIRYEGLDDTQAANKFLKCTRGANPQSFTSNATIKVAPFIALQTTSDTEFKKFEGQFANDPSGTDITISLSAETGIAYFDSVQIVSGGSVPEYGPNTVVDTGDQTIYGSLRIGRSSDEKGGILSVDKFVRARGVELFTDDPGLTGAMGGGAATMGGSGVFPPGPGWNNTTGQPTSIQLFVSGVYSGATSRDYKVVIGTGGTKYTWYYMDDGTGWNYQTGGADITPLPTTEALLGGDSTAKSGIKIKFSAGSGTADDTWYFHASNEAAFQANMSFQKETLYTPGKTRIYVDPDRASTYYNKLVFEDGMTKVSLSDLASAVTNSTPSYIGPVNRWTSNQGWLDMSASGSYTPPAPFFGNCNYEIVIVSNGTGQQDVSPSSDTFKYRINNNNTWSAWSAEQAISGNQQSVGNGIYIQFYDPDFNGYYLSGRPGDTWAFTAFAGATGSGKVTSLNGKNGAITLEAGNNVIINNIEQGRIIISATAVDGSSSNELNTSVSWTDITNTLSVTDSGGEKSAVIDGFLEAVNASSPLSGSGTQASALTLQLAANSGLEDSTGLRVATALAGNGLGGGGGSALAVNVDDTSLAITNDILGVKANGINDTHIDWGTGAGQVSADDIGDGVTNAIITLLQETNFTTAYTHSQVAGGDSVHVSTTENTNWDSAYTHSIDNSQAHTDYLLNNASDVMAGTLTIATAAPSDLIIDNTTVGDVNTVGDLASDSGNIILRGNFFTDATNANTELDMAARLDITDASTYKLSIFDNTGTNEIASLNQAGGLQIDGSLTVSGGTIDLGAGVNDDLTATDITDLTDGGETTLHIHTGLAPAAHALTHMTGGDDLVYWGSLTKANGDATTISGEISAHADLTAAHGVTAAGSVVVGTIDTQTLSNKTLTAPKFADLGYIADANGNEILILDTVGSSVNELTVANAAAAGKPTITATGADDNISINIVPKGTGTVQVAGTAVSLSTHNHSGTYEPVITVGQDTQYWRGDKTWQTLDKSAVGLSNLDNTQQMPASYLDATTTLGTSDVKVPTQNAVKAYVDANIAGLSWKEAVLGIANHTLTPPTQVSGDRYLLSEIVGVTHADWGDGITKGRIVQFNGANWVQEAPEDGDAVFVENVDTGYVYATNTWTPFTGATAYTWGNGLANTSGTTIDVQVGNGIQISSDAVTAKESEIDHDLLKNFLAAEHVNWAVQNAGTIHASNYVDNIDDSVSGAELDGAFSTTGLLTRTGAATYSTITDSSANWDTAYTHSQDNSQAHSDYLLNNADDVMAGTLTIQSTAPKDLIIDNSTVGTDADSGYITLRGNDYVDPNNTELDMNVFLDVTSTADYKLSIKNDGKAAEIASLDESGNLQIDGDAIISGGAVTLGDAANQAGSIVLYDGDETIGETVTIQPSAISDGQSWIMKLPSAIAAGESFLKMGVDGIIDYDTNIYLTSEVDGSTTNELPTPGNDIDVSDTQVSIESQLDYVTTINRASANLLLKTTTSGDILLTPAGNVGIGTAAPAALLDAYNKPANGSGAVTTVLIKPDYSLLNTAGDGYTAVKVNITDAAVGADQAKNLLDLQVADSSKFKVTSAGVVTVAGDMTISGGDITGINSTAIDMGEAGSGIVAVTGNVSTTGDLDINGAGTSDFAGSVTVHGTLTTDTLAATTMDSSGTTSETFTVNSDNTTNQITTLALGGAGSGSGKISTTAGALNIQPSAGSNVNLTLSTTGDFAVNTDHLYVDTSATNVGIGTTAPGQKLHVIGGIKAATDNTADADGYLYLGNDGHYLMWDDNYVAKDWEGYDVTGWFKSDEGMSVKNLEIRGSSPAVITFGSGTDAKQLQFDSTTQEFSFTGGKLKQQFQNLVRGGSFESWSTPGWYSAWYGGAYTTTGYAKFGTKSLYIYDSSTMETAFKAYYIPNWDRLKGRYVTLSVWATCGSSMSTASIGIGTDAYSNEANQVVNINISPDYQNNTEWRNFTQTFLVPNNATTLKVYLYGAGGTGGVPTPSTTSASGTYFDGVTLVEGKLSLEYGPSPVFDTGDQVVGGSLAIGADINPYEMYGWESMFKYPRLIFGEPDANFGGFSDAYSYGGYNYSTYGGGTGEISYRRINPYSGGNTAQFVFNRPIGMDIYDTYYNWNTWATPALFIGNLANRTYTQGGSMPDEPDYARSTSDAFIAGIVESRGGIYADVMGKSGGVGISSNLLKYSEDFTQSDWVKSASVNTGYLAPDGTNSAVQVYGDYIQQTIYSVEPGQAYTFSVYLSPDSDYEAVLHLVRNGGSDYEYSGYPYYRPDNFRSATLYNIYYNTNPWRRFSVTYTPPSGTTSLTAKISSVYGIRVWGAQLRKASSPGVYIKTTATTNPNSTSLFHGDGSDLVNLPASSITSGTAAITGITGNIFTINEDLGPSTPPTADNLSLSFNRGSLADATLVWNESGTVFDFNQPVRIINYKNLTVSGQIIAGTGSNTITTAAGLLDAAKLTGTMPVGSLPSDGYGTTYINVIGDTMTGALNIGTGGYSSGGITLNTDGSLQVGGSIYYKGKIYQENVQELLVADHIITMNSGGTAQDAFIKVDNTYGQIKWNQAAGAWQISSTMPAGFYNILHANTSFGGDVSGTAADLQIGASAVTGAEITDSAVTSAKIADGAIVDADINGSAGILGTKISPDFGSQNILTNGNIGIGTAFPAQKLDINGTVRSTGAIIGSLSGVLKAVSGTVYAAASGTDYEIPLTFNNPLSRSVNAVGLYYNSTNLKLTDNALNTIQDIASNSSPTFAGATITSNLGVNGTLTPGAVAMPAEAYITWGTSGKIVVTPEYPNASLYGDGSSNNGTLALKNTADANWRNYYEWSSQSGALQDYTIVERFTLPQDFSGWAGSSAIRLAYVTQTASDTDNKVDVAVYRGGSASATLTSSANVSASWLDLVIDDSDLGSWNPGDVLIVEIKTYSNGGKYVRVGDITLNYTR